MLLLTRSPNFLIRTGFAPGYGYFVKLFHKGVQDLLRRILVKGKPKKVLVCMIYYPDTEKGGWADQTLELLGYNKEPQKLQVTTVYFAYIACVPLLLLN